MSIFYLLILFLLHSICNSTHRPKYVPVTPTLYFCVFIYLYTTTWHQKQLRCLTRIRKAAVSNQGHGTGNVSFVVPQVYPQANTRNVPSNASCFHAHLSTSYSSNLYFMPETLSLNNLVPVPHSTTFNWNYDSVFVGSKLSKVHYDTNRRFLQIYSNLITDSCIHQNAEHMKI